MFGFVYTSKFCPSQQNVTPQMYGRNIHSSIHCKAFTVQSIETESDESKLFKPSINRIKLGIFA